jgi:hypothetical protein
LEDKKAVRIRSLTEDSKQQSFVPITRSSPGTIDPIEKVEVDQSNYDERPSYNPDLPGEAMMNVPLAVPKVALKAELLIVQLKQLQGVDFLEPTHRKSRLLNITSSIQKLSC